jgi:chitin disaccharide deacetylase
VIESSIASSTGRAVSVEAPPLNGTAISAGRLIVNADDWGRDQETTERMFECVQCGAVSSVSAMVFMEDSERAAGTAREHGVDAGLHLNFTGRFSAANCSTRLLEHQDAVAKYLKRNPLARGVYNPWLAASFEYLVEAQIAEFTRLYGAAPERIDGHHHMHLSANVLLGGLLPAGIILRRHFSHEAGEKFLRNGVFRWVTDAMLTRRYRVADHFFSIIPLEPQPRLQKIFALAERSVVELETHPVDPGEYRFLAGGEIFRWMGNARIASSYELTRGRRQ